MSAPNQEPTDVSKEKTGVRAVADPRGEPASASTPIAPVALTSDHEERPPQAKTPQSVVERLITETLSNRPPIPPGDVDAYIRWIDDLNATIASKNARIAELELLLAADDGSEIVRDELERTRAHAARLDARLAAERDQSAAIEAEKEALRASFDAVKAEAAGLEETLRAQRAENTRLAEEALLLRRSFEGSKKPGR
jgi:hypothetical protein